MKNQVISKMSLYTLEFSCVHAILLTLSPWIKINVLLLKTTVLSVQNSTLPFPEAYAINYLEQVLSNLANGGNDVWLSILVFQRISLIYVFFSNWGTLFLKKLEKIQVEIYNAPVFILPQHSHSQISHKLPVVFCTRSRTKRVVLKVILYSLKTPNQKQSR